MEFNLYIAIIHWIMLSYFIMFTCFSLLLFSFRIINAMLKKNLLGLAYYWWIGCYHGIALHDQLNNSIKRILLYIFR